MGMLYSPAMVQRLSQILNYNYKGKNMKIQMREITEYEAKSLKVNANIRYWEDIRLNGEEKGNEDGAGVPCKNGESWCPIIDIDSGIIVNWVLGVTADIHAKVCDDGSYSVLNSDGEILYSEENCYVPDILDTSDKGYGDYIIMKVDETGKIADWNPAKIQSFIGDIAE